MSSRGIGLEKGERRRSMMIEGVTKTNEDGEGQGFNSRWTSIVGHL